MFTHNHHRNGIEMIVIPERATPMPQNHGEMNAQNHYRGLVSTKASMMTQNIIETGPKLSHLLLSHSHFQK
jgi:hypothetical protein